MGQGYWSRWGSPHKGGCEGYALGIGVAFAGYIVRRDSLGEAPMWECSINTRRVDEFPDLDLAKRRIEEIIEMDMRVVLRDWETYQAAKGKK